MIGLGIVLIVLGLLLPSLVPTFAFAHLCFVVGVILLVVGLSMMLLGRMGHAVGGRRKLLLLLRHPAGTDGSGCYAAGLDECSLAPYILNQSIAVRTNVLPKCPVAQQKMRRSGSDATLRTLTRSPSFPTSAETRKTS